MTIRKVQLSRKAFIVLAVYVLVSYNKVNGVGKRVTHVCREVEDNTEEVNLLVRILINDDQVYKVYAFDAVNNDTSKETNRISEAACIKDKTGITNTATEPILYTFTVAIKDTSQPCGINVEERDGVQYVKFLFRIYAHTDTVNSPDDISFVAECRMDDLTGATVSTSQLDISGDGNVILQQQFKGVYLRILEADTGSKVIVGKIGDPVFMSVEFYPELELGPDNYGSHFFIGFLGIDPISGTSASEQYIVVYPRYKVQTTVVTTTKYGSEKYDLENGLPEKIPMPSDLMGCSNDGYAEIEDKGVEIQIFGPEAGVLVCSAETGTADCYIALPNDVTGTEYIATSMPAAEESSELMIISHADGNSVTIDIPDNYAHMITLNGTSSSPGGEKTITLNKRMAFHLAQSSATASRSNVNGYMIKSNSPISVITGNRNFVNDHLLDQLPPILKFGKDYVLIPVDPRNDDRLTIYVIQPVQAGITMVTRYLSASASETHTVTYREFLMIDVKSDEPCELTADKPIMVTQIVTAPDPDLGFGTSMALLPPVTRWSHQYTMYHPDYALDVLTVFKSNTGADAFRVNNREIKPTTSPVLGPSGYVFGSAVSLSNDEYTLKLDDAVSISTFMAIGCLGVGAGNIGITTGLWGYKLSDIDQCVRVGRRGDKFDNDCDGEADEEIVNGLDDDGDGYADEDARASTSEFAGVVAVRPVSCKVSPGPTFDTSNDITKADGCSITDSELFKPEGQFSPQTGDNIGSGIQPKFLYSGVFNLAQYFGKQKLYFMCDIEYYCTSTSDTRCTDICGGGGRKRREDGTPPMLNNITTDIWVLPYSMYPEKPTVTETVQDAASFKTCMNNAYIQMSFVLLTLLILVSFFTALCFCCLLRRRNKRDKEKERILYHRRHNKRF